MLSRRKFIKIAAPAIILPPWRDVKAAFSAAASSNHVPQRFPVGVDSTNTWLVDQYGAPCFALGDSPQIGPNMLNTSDLETYFSDRAARGINIAWMIFPDNVYQTSPPANVYGNSPFSGGDFLGMSSQTAFWNYVDYIMQRALYWGITILFNVAFIGLGIGGATDGYRVSWNAASTATLQAYANFLAARYANFPNLIWLLGGDADPNDATLYSQLNIFGTALAAADGGKHLITLEAARFSESGSQYPNNGYSSVEAQILAYGAAKSWLTLNWVYPIGTAIPAVPQRGYREGNIPNIMGEDWYALEHSPTTTYQFLRQEGWGAVLGGCTVGRLMGNAAGWGFNSIHGDSCCTSTPTWQSQLSATDSVCHQIMGAALRSREHWKLVPDATNTYLTSSTGGICARTSDGQSIIAYLPSTQNATFNMAGITDAGSQAVIWLFDPAIGAARKVGTFANSGSQSVALQANNGLGDQDMCVFIDSVAANLGAPI